MPKPKTTTYYQGAAVQLYDKNGGYSIVNVTTITILEKNGTRSHLNLTDGIGTIGISPDAVKYWSHKADISAALVFAGILCAIAVLYCCVGLCQKCERSLRERHMEKRRLQGKKYNEINGRAGVCEFLQLIGILGLQLSG